VRSPVLYGCETRRLTTTAARKLQSFTNRCLRRITGIRWFDHVTNTVGKDWPETSEANHPGEALEMDRPHSEETGIEHHKTGSVMEPSGETETRKTQSDMEERGRGRDEKVG